MNRLCSSVTTVRRFSRPSRFSRPPRRRLSLSSPVMRGSRSSTRATFLRGRSRYRRATRSGTSSPRYGRASAARSTSSIGSARAPGSRASCSRAAGPPACVLLSFFSDSSRALTISTESQPALIARAQTRGLLAAHEVQRILLRLLEAGKVARRSLDSVAGGGLAEGEIDWEGDRWFLDGTCW